MKLKRDFEIRFVIEFGISCGENFPKVDLNSMHGLST